MSQVGGVPVAKQASLHEILQCAVSAMNAHDLDALVACFHPDYESIQPAHPGRSFRGHERVAENWGWVFERFPDFYAEIVDCVTRDQTAWTEWHWSGTDVNGVEVDVRGVTVLDVEAGKIRRGRLFLEPVDDS